MSRNDRLYIYTTGKFGKTAKDPKIQKLSMDIWVVTIEATKGRSFILFPWSSKSHTVLISIPDGKVYHYYGKLDTIVTIFDFEKSNNKLIKRVCFLKTLLWYSKFLRFQKSLHGSPELGPNFYIIFDEKMG